ncbi:MAG: hypothetical protein HXY47_03245 [Nitrospirae bacterium]|nr:hypothetical protein [Nitrospirota bacterium]
MKKIIVDIDNTLWDFAFVFYERLKKIAPAIPSTDLWDWDFYKNYISIDDLHSVIDGIHRDQDLFQPFPSAKWFLESLSDKGYSLIIASHRRDNFRKATEHFFLKHNLPYHELHLCHDKTILFDGSCCALVDDAPILLDKARQKGIICTGLRYPWNKHTEHPLFNSLEDVLNFLLEELDG